MRTNPQVLLQALDRLEELAGASFWERLWFSPLRHVEVALYRALPAARQERNARCQTFFGVPMHLLLPFGSDIYTTGGKTQPAEIRLARFFVRYLREGDSLVDFGAEYGYFSLLVSKLVGTTGHVVAFEPAPAAYAILKINCKGLSNLSTYHLALSNREALQTFYEFSGIYSGYNTFELDQIEREEWFAECSPRIVKVPCVRLDTFLSEMNYRPTFLRIAIESSKEKVISGAMGYLERHLPTVILRYRTQQTDASSNQRTEALLRALRYAPFCITSSGELRPVDDATDYLLKSRLDVEYLIYTSHGINSSS
ncbi:MAG: FkbM family methyltransferase [Saprospiraceae bacterium]|nr:FkbM family methyltransferase [Saprospiraceae bacterium]MDW8483172.1 FkbM family methyltransferase [Saprospiraceae bacterium]